MILISLTLLSSIICTIALPATKPRDIGISMPTSTHEGISPLNITLPIEHAHVRLKGVPMKAWCVKNMFFGDKDIWPAIHQQPPRSSSNKYPRRYYNSNKLNMGACNPRQAMWEFPIFPNGKIMYISKGVQEDRYAGTDRVVYNGARQVCNVITHQGVDGSNFRACKVEW